MDLIRVYSQTDLAGIEQLLGSKGFSRRKIPNQSMVWEYANEDAKGQFMGVYEYAIREYFQVWPEAIASDNPRADENLGRPEQLTADNFDIKADRQYMAETGTPATSIVTLFDESVMRFLDSVKPTQRNPLIVVVNQLERPYFFTGKKMYGPGYLEQMQQEGTAVLKD